MALILTFTDQQSIRPLASLNATNTAAVARYNQMAAEVESLELDKLLGSAMYQDISNYPANYANILNATSFVNRDGFTLKHKGLKYVIAYLNYAKYIGDSYINDTFTGFVQKVRPDSEKISSGEIKRLQQEAKEIAYNAFNLIREYMYINSLSYPLWTNNRKKDIKINKQFYGINFRHHL